MMLRKHSAVALAAAVLLAGCSASRPATGSATGTSMPMGSVTAPAAPVSGNQVNIDGFAFAPATLTVPVGTTVTWTNRDEEPHTVAASDGSFHSPGMGTGATFTHTFSDAGTFDYVCSIHPMMRGSVVVTR
ncbi:amidase [Mycobacterium sp. 852002-53434_SCH5985345]|uniref:cupredoxin domain-containing protein n=1 Tax=Mycobacterium sp. 852002-53434_SCH5985345 TaxID=1834107 RepID=UPI0007FFFFC3|nr:cupredoxin family copper-binding protein [Mycobacterium sp. 852002-53434_SCH5985345]OBF61528.1 amidase [Mycobacterium sp. 852002-53434_SCH5985345]